MAKRKPRTAGTAARKRRALRRPVRAASTESRAGSAKAGSTSKKGRAATRRKPKRPVVVAQTGGVTITEVEELDALRRELERTAGRSAMRWNADPEDVQRSVAQLVLTLVEFIRKLLERQAIRRMDAGTLTEQQTEEIGRALMKLEETVVDIGAKFGVLPEDLNLDLGPVGKLM